MPEPSIPFVDLRGMHDPIQPEIESAMRRVFERCSFIGGEECDAFERELAASLGVAHAVGASSCTSALSMAFLALGLSRGDEVVVPAHTYIASAEAITFVGGEVRLADCGANTHLVTVETLERAVTPRTRALVIVHLYGTPCDMDSILGFARSRGLKVIEDCAQSQGSLFKGRATGTFGDVGCFSFFPSKNLGAAGDAGALVTNNAEVAAHARLIANHGRREKFVHEILGYNFRLDALQAAILRVKLRHLDGWNAARRAAARLYDERLPGLQSVVLPGRTTGGDSAPHLYAIRVAQRDRVAAHLKQRGIGTGIHYPLPLHLHPAFAGLGLGRGDLPRAEAWCDETLSLPIHGAIAPESVLRVCDALRDVLREVLRGQ